MDKTRCAAVAVDGFGRTARDSIFFKGDGSLALTRQFTDPDAQPIPGRKSLRFWIHFVTNPVQFTAATSPQAMQSPLMVEWR
jgi:hypothetical protein